MDTPSVALEKPVVVLIGNYPLDRQQSMLRFRDLIQARLEALGHTVESIYPDGILGPLVRGGGLAKWIAYVDKYVLFPLTLARQLSALRKKYAGRKIVVHICDHSNSVYVGVARRFFPVLVTCHDLLAVRGALGEDTDCPASGFGKKLQAAILRGLGQATAIACVSRATQGDLIRLAGSGITARTHLVPLALNYPFRPLPPEEAMATLKRAGLDLPYRGYILHVGSSLRRKNRVALFRAVDKIRDKWAGLIVLAGEPLSADETNEIRPLKLDDRLRSISGVDGETLLALYAAAHAFVFPSRFEGFGWPVLEAQMTGCPLICSNRTSVPEVAGEGALVHDPDDAEGKARDILRLQEPAFRESLIALGRKNAQAYTIERMMSSYEKIYREI
jgi:glycosyltransferase involved in cell wall biosynthesis